jgi:hypothetical protein
MSVKAIESMLCFSGVISRTDSLLLIERSASLCLHKKIMKEATMINTYHPVEKQMDDCEDIPYDLSYDDMDSFVRSCGVVLPETGARESETVLRGAPFI